GCIEEGSGGRKVVSDGLLDQDIEAGVHEAAAEIAVSAGGSGDDCGVGALGTRREVVEGLEDGALVGRLGLSDGGGVGVEDAGEIGVWGLLDDADVIASEGAYADDGDAGVRGHDSFSQRRLAKEQRGKEAKKQRSKRYDGVVKHAPPYS